MSGVWKLPTSCPSFAAAAATTAASTTNTAMVAKTATTSSAAGSSCILFPPLTVSGLCTQVVKTVTKPEVAQKPRGVHIHLVGVMFSNPTYRTLQRRRF